MSTITYKCSNCGGPLEFNAETQSWKCEFCLSDFNEQEARAFKDEEEDVSLQDTSQEKNVMFESNARAYSCPSCGAEIVTDDTTAATFCYYCHNPTILPGRLSGNYRPSKVIPFKFEKVIATEFFIKWCKKKPLLSKDFTSRSQLELLSGVYVPFWLYDCDIRGRMSASARDVRTWTTGDKRYTETKYYDVLRTGTAKFRGVPADGSKKADDKLMETLEPYDYSQMKDFSMSYLSGYLAEKYDVNDNEVYERISERIKKYSGNLLEKTITGHSSVSINNCDVDIYKSKVAYVLLPTWMFTYNYQGKTYMFAMNGQTGKIAGSLPLSKAKMALWFVGISVLAFMILVLIGGLFL